MRPRLTNHPFQPKLPITKVLVPLLYRESIASPKFTEIHPAISLIAPYKVLPVSEIILKRASFSSPSPPSSFQTNTLLEHTIVLSHKSLTS